MTTIFKYPLQIIDRQEIDIPMSVQHNEMTVGLDPSGALCIWARVNTRIPSRKWVFYIVGTGNELPINAGHRIGSVTQGAFVWHIFQGETIFLA